MIIQNSKLRVSEYYCPNGDLEVQDLSEFFETFGFHSKFETFEDGDFFWNGKYVYTSGNYYIVSKTV